VLLGNFLLRRNRSVEAASAYEAAVAYGAGSFETLVSLAHALKAANRAADAVSAFAKALSLKPGAAEIVIDLGNLHAALGQHTEAVKFLRRALELRPMAADVANNLGQSYRALGFFREAESAFERALLLKSDLVEAHLNLGSLRQAAGHLDEAIGAYERALSIGRRKESALYNLATAYEAKRDYNRALEYLEQAVAIKADFAEAQRNKGLIELSLCRFSTGWQAYAWRWSCPDFDGSERPFSQPRWRGEKDAHVLVWSEQGIGDELLYGSMVADLQRRAASVMWETDVRLVPLIARSYPEISVVARSPLPHPATAQATAQIPIASMGEFLRPDRSQFLSRAGYLKADSARTESYRRRLGLGKRLIGISWVSHATTIGGAKSMALDDLATKLARPDVSLIDLQYGDTRAERGQLKTRRGIELCHLDDLDLRDDVDGLAALVAACDLVITVSNTTAHLAGGLGVPVWVLVPLGAAKLWYWGNDGAYTPWYPSARLFRQTRPGVWSDVADALAAALAHYPADNIRSRSENQRPA
jgi:Tfp pilus assembly protein PilF